MRDANTRAAFTPPKAEESLSDAALGKGVLTALSRTAHAGSSSPSPAAAGSEISAHSIEQSQRFEDAGRAEGVTYLGLERVNDGGRVFAERDPQRLGFSGVVERCRRGMRAYEVDARPRDAGVGEGERRGAGEACPVLSGAVMWTASVEAPKPTTCGNERRGVRHVARRWRGELQRDHAGTFADGHPVAPHAKGARARGGGGAQRFEPGSHELRNGVESAGQRDLGNARARASAARDRRRGSMTRTLRARARAGKSPAPSRRSRLRGARNTSRRGERFRDRLAAGTRGEERSAVNMPPLDVPIQSRFGSRASAAALRRGARALLQRGS